MKSQVLSSFNLPLLPLTALILFLLVFVVMLLMVFNKKSKGHQTEASMVPLNDAGELNER